MACVVAGITSPDEKGDGADGGFLQEIEELVDDWAPEPLVSEPTPIEMAEQEKIPVIVGYGHF